jgi:hypothetical protein
VKRFYLPSLERGASRDFPPSLGINAEDPGAPLFASLANLRPSHGGLTRRGGAVELASPPSLDSAHAQTVILLEELYTGPAATAGTAFLLVTNREMWIGAPTRWENVTPVYEVGTVNVTNGSPTVLGTGTAWQTRRIAATQLFKGPDGVYHTIASVNGDFSITLATNYGGATLSGQAYTIRRTFGIGADPDEYASHAVFLARQNADLYLAGQFSWGLFDAASATIPDGCVVKVPYAYSPLQVGSFDPADTEYVMSGRSEVVSGIDALGYNIYPYGLAALPDGRLVVPVHWYNSGSGDAGDNRVLYSSLLSTAVWTVSPGGATDLTDHKGAITGQTHRGGRLHIHFTDGVEIGEPTNKDDPPLRFFASRAETGAIGPKMLLSIPGGAGVSVGDLFVGPDHNLRSFNGSYDQVVDPAFRRYLLPEGPHAPADVAAIREGFAFYDPDHSEVAFFVYSGNGTREVRYQVDTRRLWHADYAARVTAASIASAYVLEDFGADTWDYERQRRALYLGTRSSTNWLFYLDEQTFSDDSDLAPLTGPGFLLDLFDGQGAPERGKVIVQVLLWARLPPFRESNATETLKLDVIRDDGSLETKTASATALFDAASLTEIPKPEVLYLFTLDEVSFSTARLAVRSNDDNTFTPQLTRMLIEYEVVGDVRAL